MHSKGWLILNRKAKIIGKNFIDVFDAEALKLENIKWLAQGTIYADRIESLSITGMVIKLHHNVGGLPEKMNLKVIEPLKLLFRWSTKVGRSLEIPDSLINRHPFSVPDWQCVFWVILPLEKVQILQEVDHIFINGIGIEEVKLYYEVWQAGAVLLPINL